MTTFRFVRPTLWRVVWSIVAAAFVVYITGIVVVYVLALTTHGVGQPSSSNTYVGLLMWDIVFAAPVFVLFFWWATIPVIIGLGVLAACMRRRTPAATMCPQAASEFKEVLRACHSVCLRREAL
jgi:hypothetical protein